MKYRVFDTEEQALKFLIQIKLLFCQIVYIRYKLLPTRSSL